MKTKDIEAFRNREVKAKNLFYIERISKIEAYDFVRRFHYLGDAKFFCCDAFGLFTKDGDELVGCATYSCPQGIVALKGWFGLTNDTKDIYELSRLCMLPDLNGTNATSFLLGGSLKQLRREGYCRAVVTLACSERHVGSIYQVCNFKFYGLTDKKTDFFCADGRVNPRGQTKGLDGVWVPRPRKYRYAYIFDKSLKCLYEEEKRPESSGVINLKCCNGSHVVTDGRTGSRYSCPRCLDYLYKLEDWM